MKIKLLFSAFFVATAISGFAALRVNEVNSTGKWIEIYNDGTASVNIGGYTVTRNNNDGAVAAATIPFGTNIPAKGYVVLYQGSAAPLPAQGAIDCLSFGIASDKFRNVVLKNNLGVVQDTFDVGNPQNVTVSWGRSWARQTDGSNVIVELEPSPGKANGSPPSYSAMKLFINEVNSTGKWIEIYNDENVAVNPEGFSVMRYNNTGAVSQAIIPSGITIPSKGFLVIYRGTASGGTAPRPIRSAVDCMPFGISSARFSRAVLRDAKGDIIDALDVGNPQTVTVSEGKSWARATDGNNSVLAYEPSPGKSNSPTPAYSSVKLAINEVNSTGKWIEIYNDENHAVNIEYFTITRYNNDGAVAVAGIPAGVTIASKGFVVIFEGFASGGDAPSPHFDAIDCLTYGISSDKFWKITLKDDVGDIVDYTFDVGDPQTVTVVEPKSWGRKTEGDPAIQAQNPTPGLANATEVSLPKINGVESYRAVVRSGILWLPENTSGVHLYDISGSLVLSSSITTGSIDLSGLTKGFYVVKMIISGKEYTWKIIL